MLRSTVLALLVLGGSAGFAAAQDAAVIACGEFGRIVNPDFGSAADLFWWDESAGVSWVAEDSDGAEGSGSLEALRSTFGSESAGMCIPVRKGKSYVFGADLRLGLEEDAEGEAALVARWFKDDDCENEVPDLWDAVSVVDASDWTAVEMTSTAPANAVAVLFEFRVAKTGGSEGSVVSGGFDDASLFSARIPSCGDPVCASDRISSQDALFVLRASVGTYPCSDCYCDVNGSGDISASDALTTLQASVNLDVPLACPACD